MPKRVAEWVVRIERSGNSLSLPLPPEIVDQLKLKAGDPVIVTVRGDTFNVRRVRSRRKCSEIELLNGVTPSMCGPDLVPDRAGNELI
jgi:antitoxin component of MazEF toxin-antitoxin module